MPGAFDNQYRSFHMNPDRLAFSFTLAIGGTGAVGAKSGGGADFNFTRSGTGTYTFTMPKSVDIELSAIGLESPLGTVVSAPFTAISAANGTGGFITRNAAGTATDPASGDKLHISGWVKYKGVD